jgi:hypothetical protein
MPISSSSWISSRTRRRSGPAAFVAAPIFKDGRRLGVLPSGPLDRIDAVMTGDRQWEAQGLGRTGETYLIGSDHRMRSDSRFFLEAPQRCLDTASGRRTGPRRLMQVTGAPFSSTSRTAAATAALKGHPGASTQLDDRGEQVLASYAPVTIPNLDWAIIAKLDTVEAFAPVIALRRALLGTGAGIAVLGSDCPGAGGRSPRPFTASSRGWASSAGATCHTV